MQDCTIDQCLKRRFGPAHSCPGPTKPELGFQFLSLLTRSAELKPNQTPAASSANWATVFHNAASTVEASAQAGMANLSTEISRAWQTAKNGAGPSSESRLEEECPQCVARFASVPTLVEHVQKVHEKSTGNQSRVIKLPVDVCPKCSRGFRDPVALVEHVETEHAGSSRA